MEGCYDVDVAPLSFVGLSKKYYKRLKKIIKVFGISKNTRFVLILIIIKLISLELLHFLIVLFKSN